ncbi:Predicted outer membrane lipoprotein (plasmid) [Legionella adelaidensis]|uniref:Predicted outer membrane lipoprotein n=1 Tax=Legionella adelaidensis TaxID=45056 RepID=A0A3S4YJ84_9GAMM|nr:cytochrome bd-I oxidase subunit CydX [Legionella adelaidensis]VEH86042.1 Predicted outer membrane lipoprotein [Legionella adelaidensis]
MWYFSWILGTGLACTFAILNALWLELRVNEIQDEPNQNERRL